MAEEKLSPRRESKLFRAGRNQKAVASNILEAIAQLRGGDRREDGVPPTRMKIVVKKEDLKQVVEAIRDCRGAVRRASAGATSLEQRLNLMRRRQIMRGASARQVRGRSRLGPWRPVLQSIPEEVV
ncbi:hypothetical protein Salat_1596400 [Sesamum alatum]|uniref:Uncharacterized protein n=1 Tax=Sesamum alatum TaxID=300844 RepID=A0AAE1Y5C3_9LAMI|nr:hypothetical protein Salat_1596400 [Sesamum alatum]